MRYRYTSIDGVVQYHRERVRGSGYMVVGARSHTQDGYEIMVTRSGDRWLAMATTHWIPTRSTVPNPIHMYIH